MTAFTAVLLYAAWMLVLTLAYAGQRVPRALIGQTAIDSWERGKEPADPPFLQRAKAAHLNCVEGFPLFAGVVIIAALMDQIALANGVAAYILYARVAQGVVHISGASFIQIMLRATFFLVQVALLFYLIFKLIG